MKLTDALNSNLTGITTLHVSGSVSAHYQEFLAVQRLWYIFAYLMTVRYQEQDVTAPGNERSSYLHKMCQCRCTAKNS